MVIEITPQTGGFCPECGGATIDVHQRGEIVCQHCGLVLSEKSVDVNHSGIRAYSKHEKDKKYHNELQII